MFLAKGGEQPEDTRSQASQDPYLIEKNRQEKEAAKIRQDSPYALLGLFKDKLKGRGARGMVGLQRIFKIMDDDNTGNLSRREFAKACKDFRIGISEENIPTLFTLFDKNGDGTLSQEEFLNQVRGQLNQRRLDVVKKAFEQIGLGNATLSLNEVKTKYDASRHPDVIHGKRSEQSVVCEFIETFEAHHLMTHEQDRGARITWP